MDNKQLIKETIKGMIRDGEIEIVWNEHPVLLEKVEDFADVTGILEYTEFRLEVKEGE